MEHVLPWMQREAKRLHVRLSCNEWSSTKALVKEYWELSHLADQREIQTHRDLLYIAGQVLRRESATAVWSFPSYRGQRYTYISH